MTNGNFTLNVLRVAPVKQQSSATVGVRLFGAVTFSLLIFVSMLINGTLIVILIRGRHYFSRIPFYTIVWQFIICDYMEYASQILIAVPITLIGEEVYDRDSVAFRLFAVLETFAYYGELYFNFLLAVNRVCVFFLRKLNDRIFEFPRLKFTIGFTWCFVICVVATINITSCTKNFSATDFYFFHDCHETLTGWKYFTEKLITVYLCANLPLVILIVYLLIFFYIQFHRSNMEASNKSNFFKRSRRLEVEFLLQVLPHIQSFVGDRSWPRYFLDFAGNYCVILNFSVSPFILFVFNAEIRKRMRRIRNTLVGGTETRASPLSVQRKSGVPIKARVTSISAVYRGRAAVFKV